MATVGRAIWMGESPQGTQAEVRAVAGSEREEAGQSSEEQVASSPSLFNRVSGSYHLFFHRVVRQRSSQQKPPKRLGDWSLQCGFLANAHSKSLL